MKWGSSGAFEVGEVDKDLKSVTILESILPIMMDEVKSANFMPASKQETDSFSIRPVYPKGFRGFPFQLRSP